MIEGLGQHEFENLAAYLDGELPDDQAARVRALVEQDARWRQARQRLAALDDALGAYEPPPAPADLADRIIAAARRPARTHRVIRVIRRLAPLATAAAVLVAVAIWQPWRTGPTIMQATQDDGLPPALTAELAQNLPDVPAEDRFLVWNLDFFSDYAVVENFDMLQDIDRLEQAGRGRQGT